MAIGNVDGITRTGYGTITPSTEGNPMGSYAFVISLKVTDERFLLFAVESGNVVNPKIYSGLIHNGTARWSRLDNV